MIHLTHPDKKNYQMDSKSKNMGESNMIMKKFIGPLTFSHDPITRSQYS